MQYLNIKNNKFIATHKYQQVVEFIEQLFSEMHTFLHVDFALSQNNINYNCLLACLINLALAKVYPI